MPTTNPNIAKGERQCGNDAPALGKRLDLLCLPPELQVAVFQDCPSLWSVIALRLACRHHNTVYLANEEWIKNALIKRLVTPFYDHYKFLTRLWMPESSITCPPQSGWPDITADILGPVLRKTGFAIDVLRHLPYIEGGVPRLKNRTNINYRCGVVNYSTFTPEKHELNLLEDGHQITKHDIIIAKRNGCCHCSRIDMVLDTLMGTIYERISKRDRPRLVENYFTDMRRSCENLDFVFLPGGDPWEGQDYEIDEDDEENPNDDDNQRHRPYNAVETEAEGPPIRGDDLARLRWVRHLYRKFGWPGSDWQREDARVAIENFLDATNSRETDRCFGCRHLFD